MAAGADGPGVTSNVTELGKPDVRVDEVTEVTDDVVRALTRLGRALPRYSDAPTADHVQKIVDAPSTHLLLARNEDGDIAGMMTLVVYPLPTGIRAWLEDVSVGRRGKGVGRVMTEKALAMAREAGAMDAELIVQPSQTGGLRMASLMGFGPNDEDTRRIRLA